MLLESAPRVTLSNTIQLLDASGRPVHYAGYVLSWPANTVNTYSPNGLLTERLGAGFSARKRIPGLRVCSKNYQVNGQSQGSAHHQRPGEFFEVPAVVPKNDSGTAEPRLSLPRTP